MDPNAKNTYEVDINLPDGSIQTIEMDVIGDQPPTERDALAKLEEAYEADPDSELGQLYRFTLGETDRFTLPKQDNLTDAEKFQLSNEDGSKKMPYNLAAERARNIVNTVTFEFGDELEALARSTFGDADYDKTVEQLRKQQGQYRLDRPGEAIAVAIGTGLLTGSAAVTALKKAPKLYKFIMGNPEAPLARRILTQARSGAIGGGLAGAGAAEEDDSVIGSVGLYGTIGGTIPGILIGGGAATGKIKDMIGNFLRNTGIKAGDPDKEAFEYIASTLVNQGKTPAQIQAELKRAKELGLENYQIGEMTMGTRQLAKQAFNIPSESNDIIEEALQKRKSDTTQVIEKSIINKLDIKSPDFTDDYVNELSARQAAKAREAFPEAESTLINKDAFDIEVNGKTINMLDTDLAKQAYETYRKKASQRLRPEQLPSYDELLQMDEIPTEYLVRIKRGIKGFVDDSIDTTTGKYKDDYGPKLYSDLKDFDAVIRKNNPAYAQANDQFADAAKLKEIYKQGFDYQKLSSGDLERYIQKLDDDQLEAFKIGMVNKVGDLAETVGTQDFANKVFKNDRLKNALKLMFKDNKKFNEFEELITMAGKRKKTAQQLLGGSQTQPLTEQKEVFDVIREKGISGGTIDKLTSSLSMPPAVAERIKKQLLNATPAEQQAILKSIIENQKKLNFQKAIKDLLQGGAISQSKNIPTLTEGILRGPTDRQSDNPFEGIL